MSLSKNKIKYLNSLNLKKNRDKEGVFIAEGVKLVGDLLGHFPCKLLIALPSWLQKNTHIIADEVIEVSFDELSRASLLKNPQDVLAVFDQPIYETSIEVMNQSLCLALDDIQDPGNLGTIIRLADWFGIEHIFCSYGTVDVYNPKVVQATMGALARVRLHYVNDLTNALNEYQQMGYPIYGTLLNGKNIYASDALPTKEKGIIVMGNEGNGISQSVRALVTYPLLIPSYSTDTPTSESLNVSIATAIVLAEFRRNIIP